MLVNHLITIYGTFQVGKRICTAISVSLFTFFLWGFLFFSLF